MQLVVENYRQEAQLLVPNPDRPCSIRYRIKRYVGYLPRRNGLNYTLYPEGAPFMSDVLFSTRRSTRRPYVQENPIFVQG